MRKYAASLAVVLIAGCATTGSGVHGVFQRFAGPGFTVRAVAGPDSIGRLLPGDGAAFVEFGADSCLVADLRRDGRSYTVTVTTFSRAKGAMGAYEFTRDDAGAGFVKGNSIVRVQPEKGADANSAAAVARSFSRRVPGRVLTAELYTPLPAENRIPGSEFYFMGPNVFSARFSPVLARELGVDGAIEGVAAKYRLADGGEATLVKIRFAGRTRTMEALRAFVASREGVPMVRPAPNRDYYTLFDFDAEVYIAEYGDWLVFIPDGPRGGATMRFFEFVLRSM